jgi:putative tricarboxylic transport membrane protein
LLRYNTAVPRRSLALILLIIGVAAPAAAQPAYPHLRLIAPAAPGGGWDQTARVMQQVLQSAGIVHTSSVENIPGAAGTIGLARLVSGERGNGDVAMLSGLIMLAAVVTHRSAITLRDVTPIASLIGEYEVIVVPTASPFHSMADLIRAFKAQPERISWAGGSAGGTDHILAGLVADAVGVDPRRVNYIAFAGGGETMPAILGGQVSVGINGLAGVTAYVDAGTVRVLAISSAERIPNVDMPTLREQGVDVVLENWRSLVAPPGVGDADRHRLESAVADMVRSRPWREALERYRWNDRYLAGEDFARFVESEEARVRSILRKLATGEPATAGSPGAYPLVVLGGLGICTLWAVVTGYRAREAVAEAPGAGWKAVAVITVAVLLDVALVERAGFVIASMLLFWVTARAFDPRHPTRDAVFALVVSVGAYLLFGRVLELMLPAGILSGWM